MEAILQNFGEIFMVRGSIMFVNKIRGHRVPKLDDRPICRLHPDAFTNGDLQIVHITPSTTRSNMNPAVFSLQYRPVT